MTTSHSLADSNPLDGVFTLEDQYYQEGYQLGLTDGSHAGKLEGRATGLETGFEKFKQMGMLAGKTAVWAGRVGVKDVTRNLEAKSESDSEGESESARRLRKHITTLHALTDTETTSTVNDEDACTAFDDRLKRAMAKARVVGSIMGDDKVLKEEVVDSGKGDSLGRRKNPTKVMPKIKAMKDGNEGNIEDIGMM